VVCLPHLDRSIDLNHCDPFISGGIGLALNDYLWGKCDISQAAHGVTSKLGANVKGKLYLIPSSIKVGEITRVLREGYDAQLLTRGFRGLIDALAAGCLADRHVPGPG